MIFSVRPPARPSAAHSTIAIIYLGCDQTDRIVRSHSGSAPLEWTLGCLRITVHVHGSHGSESADDDLRP